VSSRAGGVHFHVLVLIVLLGGAGGGSTPGGSCLLGRPLGRRCLLQPPSARLVLRRPGFIAYICSAGAVVVGSYLLYRYGKRRCG
jgi:hypothetical protein